MTTRDLLPDTDATIVTLYADIEIAAPPERVYRALTDPAELARWWGPAAEYASQEWEIDPRVGESWRVRMIDRDENESTIDGEFLVLDPPRTVEYTWRSSRDGFAPTVVRYDLVPCTVRGVRGTRVTVTHTGIGGITACAGSTSVPSLEWKRVLDRLARHACPMSVLALAA